MMLLRRLDDYQSWQISYAGTSILIDPWLTPEPIRGAFDRQHPAGFTSLRDLQLESGSIGAIVLCTSVNDHLRAETLKLISDVPVHGNLKAAKAARAAGCTSTHAHEVGETFVVVCTEGGEIRVTVTKTGLPLGLIAVG
jgi:L-ascorbate metabolism protein UlaG (beta-lactamase superfamily)